MTTESNKPVVTFIPHEDDYIKVGQSAYISNVQNHPSLGDVDYTHSVFCCVQTSKVVAITPEGFETANTFYKIAG
jgi:hypothetical protein